MIVILIALIAKYGRVVDNHSGTAPSCRPWNRDMQSRGYDPIANTA